MLKPAVAKKLGRSKGVGDAAWEGRPVAGKVSAKVREISHLLLALCSSVRLGVGSALEQALVLEVETLH